MSITCVDFSCLLPGSDLCFTTEDSIQALIRPPSLARQMAAPSPYAHQLRKQNYNNANGMNVGSQIANNNNNTTNTSTSSSIVNNNENNNNVTFTNQQQLMPSKSGAKHSHANAFVLSTVFVLIDTADARTVQMASAASKLLDDQCQLLNFNHGNVPNFVYVALSVEFESENEKKNTSGFVSSFPEVLLDDVLKVSKQLHKAKGRVDEVTLVF